MDGAVASPRVRGVDTDLGMVEGRLVRNVRESAVLMPATYTVVTCNPTSFVGKYALGNDEGVVFQKLFDMCSSLYTASAMDVFGKLREAETTAFLHLHQVRTTFLDCLQRPMLKANCIVDGFVRELQEVHSDLWLDRETIGELMHRVFVLEEALLSECVDTYEECCVVANALYVVEWWSNHVASVTNLYLSLIQNEVDRYVRTHMLLRDCYSLCVGGPGLPRFEEPMAVKVVMRSLRDFCSSDRGDRPAKPQFSHVGVASWWDSQLRVEAVPVTTYDGVERMAWQSCPLVFCYVDAADDIGSLVALPERPELCTMDRLILRLGYGGRSSGEDVRLGSSGPGGLHSQFGPAPGVSGVPPPAGHPAGLGIPGHDNDAHEERETLVLDLSAVDSSLPRVSIRSGALREAVGAVETGCGVQGEVSGTSQWSSLGLIPIDFCSAARLLGSNAGRRSIIRAAVDELGEQVCDRLSTGDYVAPLPGLLFQEGFLSNYPMVSLMDGPVAAAAVAVSVVQGASGTVEGSSSGTAAGPVASGAATASVPTSPARTPGRVAASGSQGATGTNAGSGLRATTTVNGAVSVGSAVGGPGASAPVHQQSSGGGAAAAAGNGFDGQRSPRGGDCVVHLSRLDTSCDPFPVLSEAVLAALLCVFPMPHFGASVPEDRSPRATCAESPMQSHRRAVNGGGGGSVTPSSGGAARSFNGAASAVSPSLGQSGLQGSGLNIDGGSEEEAEGALLSDAALIRDMNELVAVTSGDMVGACSGMQFTLRSGNSANGMLERVWSFVLQRRRSQAGRIEGGAVDSAEVASGPQTMYAAGHVSDEMDDQGLVSAREQPASDVGNVDAGDSGSVFLEGAQFLDAFVADMSSGDIMESLGSDVKRVFFTMPPVLDGPEAFWSTVSQSQIPPAIHAYLRALEEEDREFVRRIQLLYVRAATTLTSLKAMVERSYAEMERWIVRKYRRDINVAKHIVSGIRSSFLGRWGAEGCGPVVI